MIETVAKLCHDQWAGWMEYIFQKGMLNSDGSFTIPPELVKRWERQASQAYSELSESEKDSDRKEARKFIRLFDSFANERLKKLFVQYSVQYENESVEGMTVIDFPPISTFEDVMDLARTIGEMMEGKKVQQVFIRGWQRMEL